MTAAPDDHRHRIGQLATRELDLYGNQLARCLQALGTNAPIRADIQRELATVRTEQDSRRWRVTATGQPGPGQARLAHAQADPGAPQRH